MEVSKEAPLEKDLIADVPPIEDPVIEIYPIGNLDIKNILVQDSVGGVPPVNKALIEVYPNTGVTLINEQEDEMKVEDEA